MKTLCKATMAAVLGLAVVTSAKAANNGFTGYGYDSSGPEIYLIYNGTSINVATSPNITGYGLTSYADQGPYEGSDDTYIAVINQSTKTLNSINLSGPSGTGNAIFAFDGDGIQTYGSPGNAVDTTGYGGPTSWFSNISADNLNGTVNFIGGIAPGTQSYFSLEDMLTGAAGNGTFTGTVPDAGSTMAMLSAGLIGLGILRRRIQG